MIVGSFNLIRSLSTPCFHLLPVFRYTVIHTSLLPAWDLALLSIGLYILYHVIYLEGSKTVSSQLFSTITLHDEHEGF